MESATPNTVINSTLMIWCGIIIIELFIIAFLINSSMVLLLGLVMFFPMRAAWNWPCPPIQPPTGSQQPASQ